MVLMPLMARPLDADQKKSGAESWPSSKLRGQLLSRHSCEITSAGQKIQQSLLEVSRASDDCLWLGWPME